MSAAPLLSARGLCVRYGDFVAVHDASFDVARGEVHALIGPNGAGKTTCFHAISGFVRPTAGRVLFEGDDVAALPAWQRARRGLVRSFQISAVFPQLTVLDNVLAALARREAVTANLLASRRRFGPLVDEAGGLLQQVGLAADAPRLAGTLGYGQRRALEIATTLALRPALMLLDEPTAGMTEADVQRTIELLAGLAQGQTILMVEHNLKVVSRLCHKVTVLQRGEVIASGTYAQVAADPRVRSAYLGRAAR